MYTACFAQFQDNVHMAMGQVPAPRPGLKGHITGTYCCHLSPCCGNMACLISEYQICFVLRGWSHLWIRF
jgi:hypothetical protein